MIWATYDMGPGEAAVKPLDEEHTDSSVCECEPSLKIGDGYILVVHNSFYELERYEHD